MITKLREMLIRHEGKSACAYKCSAGRKTIGIGHNIDAKGLPKAIDAFLRENMCITDEMIDSLFATDVMDAMSACIKLYPAFNTFSEARKAALIDFVFNVGTARAEAFKDMKSAINGDPERNVPAGDWAKAADELRDSKYWTQLGGDPIGTDDGKLERPEEIREMLRTGEWVPQTKGAKK